MVCGTCQSLEGRVIEGRSTAGYDVRRRPLVYSRESGVPQNHVMAYNHMAQAQTIRQPIQQAPKKLEIDWGVFFWGGAIGLVAGYFLFAATGRRIAYKAAKRVGR